MRSEKIGELNLLLYDGIEEMPAYNFSRYNFFLMLDSGIGADIDSIAQRLGNMFRLSKSGKHEKYEIENNNLLQSFVFIIENTTPEHLCFVPWIHSINGERIVDLSDNAVKETILRISQGGLTVGFIRKFLKSIKKKLQMKWTHSSQN